MAMIRCTNPCLYEKEGKCTLTHVTSVSNPQKEDCVYFKDKKKDETKKYQTLSKFSDIYY